MRDESYRGGLVRQADPGSFIGWVRPPGGEWQAVWHSPVGAVDCGVQLRRHGWPARGDVVVLRVGRHPLLAMPPAVRRGE